MRLLAARSAADDDDNDDGHLDDAGDEDAERRGTASRHDSVDSADLYHRAVAADDRTELTGPVDS
jgi:hypothetical protein